MKNIVIIFLLVLVAGVVVFAAQKKSAPVKPAVRVSSPNAPKSSSFTSAATENASLRNELTWTFGGKQQRGWYLYDLLIGKTLATQHDTTTDVFAESLSKWQKKRGLAAT